MEQYSQKLTKKWWKEYGKKSGLGNFSDVYEMVENEGDFSYTDRVIVSFGKGEEKIYALFNDYALVTVTDDIEDIYKLPHESYNATEVATNKHLVKFDKEYVKLMTSTHDEKYKEKSLQFRSTIRSSYQHRFETITKKTTHYLRLLDSINNGKVRKPEYTFTNYAKKIEYYNDKSKEINKVIRYQNQVEKIIENTASTTYQK